jgi:two-component system, OmpR family, response regulator MprA
MDGTILVVENSKDITDPLRQALNDEGYSVEVAHDGIDALERLRIRCPDLIILDILMPFMDGWSFADVYQELSACSTPIIVVSALGLPERVVGMHAIVDFLPKPFDLDELLACVGKHLATKS